MRVDVAEGGGPADPGLAPGGRAQAERVVTALALDRVDAVYSSPPRPGAARPRDPDAVGPAADGLAALWARAGCEVTVVCVTDGRDAYRVAGLAPRMRDTAAATSSGRSGTASGGSPSTSNQRTSVDSSETTGTAPASASST